MLSILINFQENSNKPFLPLILDTEPINLAASRVTESAINGRTPPCLSAEVIG
jgi:hypothetical protein